MSISTNKNNRGLAMKIINFSNNNFIKSYQFYAFPLGILANDSFAYKNWMLGRFLGITLGKVLQYDEQYYNDWEITNQQLYKSIEKKDFTELIKHFIDNDQVFHIWGINEKYIPGTFAYEKYDFMHDLLIIGYDKEDVIIVNYGKDKFLTQKNISIDTLKKSFTNQTQGRSFNFINEKIKILDFTEIISNINQYLNPSKKYELKYYNAQINPKNEMPVGIYALIEYLSRQKKDFHKHTNVNGMCLLNEHKICMMNTLIYLNQQNLISNNIINEYQQIVNLSTLIKNTYLMLTLHEKITLQEQIIYNMDKMISTEQEILTTCLDTLKY